MNIIIKLFILIITLQKTLILRKYKKNVEKELHYSLQKFKGPNSKNFIVFNINNKILLLKFVFIYFLKLKFEYF